MSEKGGAQPGPINVVIIDDHHMVRVGVGASLPEHLIVVGEGANVEEAIEVIHATQPAVVLLDVHLPGGTGGGGAEVILGCRDLPDVKFLALSVSDAASDVVTVIRAGARGYVTKNISPPDLADAIVRVAEGDAVFSPRLAGFVLDAFTPGGAPVSDEPSDDVDVLSARERDVMRLIARGYTYREAAKELFISVKTVETHMSAVLRKLQLTSRHELARWAVERKIV